MTSTTSTTVALRYVAGLLDGLPGLPTPTVIVTGGALTIKFLPTAADEHHRAIAVDMLCAVVGLKARVGVVDGVDGADTYGALGEVGELSVLIYAPGTTVVVPV